MKEIKDFEGRYSATEDGKIYSHLSHRFLSPNDSGKGYLYVHLRDKEGKEKSKKVHRIIAETFIPNPDNLPCVNHKDENRQNNNVNNLEWCTYEYNNTYGDRLEKIKNKTLNCKSTSKQVKAIDKENKEELFFPSVREAARFLGDVRKSSNIQAVLAGRQKSAYGYYWEYIE